MTENMADTLQQRVARQIELAFADTPYPSEPLVGSDGEAMATALHGQRWQEVSHDLLYKFRWDMFLLTPAGFRYFAPAMMRAALLQHDQIGTVTDNLIFCLTPQSEEQINNYVAGEYNDYFSRRAAAFNATEKMAILTFLDTFAAVYPLGYLLYDIDLVGKTIEFWRYA
jgi:hypothetical protein